MRATYGADQPYTAMSVDALRLWREHEQRWHCRLFHRSGVLWLVTAADDRFERGSLPLLREAGVAFEELSAREVERRWPQMNCEGVRWAIYEPDGGFLMARRACQAVLEDFLAGGGEYRLAAVAHEGLEDGCRKGLVLSDGSKLPADQYVFACGPWLGRLFPATIGDRIRPTKQEVFFFGTPPGDGRFSDANLPVWADQGESFVYGIPAADGRGFKFADDSRGADFDPDSGERSVTAERRREARAYVGFRFPGMKDAPLLETRVCQYENTPDSHFVIDRHPSSENVWIAGGGSGHGFKHGPAVGQLVAGCVLRGAEIDPRFKLARFSLPAGTGGTPAPAQS